MIITYELLNDNLSLTNTRLQKSNTDYLSNMVDPNVTTKPRAPHATTTNPLMPRGNNTEVRIGQQHNIGCEFGRTKGHVEIQVKYENP